MPNKIFDTINVGSYELKNRIFMAPMTRGRASADGTPTDIMPEYYAQRSGAGLIITEATAVSRQGVGWVNAPGIFTDAHQEAWKAVPESVHQAGSRIFLQLWHTGRVSHPDFQEAGVLPVGPSALAAEGESHTPTGKKPYVIPRALESSELPGIIDDYVQAAQRAIEAGFDGVEVHAANGYLLDQFIRDGANQRTDNFGGSIENRWRFPLQLTEAVAGAVGRERTGIRLSPRGPFNDMKDSDPVATFTYGAGALSSLGLAYVHLLEAQPGHMMFSDGDLVHPHIRKAFAGPLILNGGYDKKLANAALEQEHADAIAFGIPFLANPDLPRRMLEDAPLNAPDFPTFYTPGAKGYTDYPSL